MRDIEEELANPNAEDLEGEFYDEESLINWYVATRAAERFRLKHNRYPGQF
jgi:hypothetical protein